MAGSQSRASAGNGNSTGVENVWDGRLAAAIAAAVTAANASQGAPPTSRSPGAESLAHVARDSERAAAYDSVNRDRTP
jgi:hypothetical protein